MLDSVKKHRKHVNHIFLDNGRITREKLFEGVFSRHTCGIIGQTNREGQVEIGQIQQRRLSDNIVEQLETMMLDGILKPGERLPAERQLAEQFRSEERRVGKEGSTGGRGRE